MDRNDNLPPVKTGHLTGVKLYFSNATMIVVALESIIGNVDILIVLAQHNLLTLFRLTTDFAEELI